MRVLMALCASLCTVVLFSATLCVPMRPYVFLCILVHHHHAFLCAIMHPDAFIRIIMCLFAHRYVMPLFLRPSAFPIYLIGIDPFHS
jgi:hypothetical protein